MPSEPVPATQIDVAASSSTEMHVEEACATGHESIVRFQGVTKEYNQMNPWEENGAGQFVGSGFIIAMDDGCPTMVTNAHVAANANIFSVQLPFIGLKKYTAQPVDVNSDWDIAFVQLSKETCAEMNADLKKHGTQLKALKLDSKRMTAGIDVTALGFPLGQESVKCTKGSISGTDMVGDNIVYQSTAPISPGNSGGPLFKAGTKEVVGINFAAAISEGSQQNNYVIPAWRLTNEIKRFQSKPHSIEQCANNPERCESKVPKMGATVVPGTPELYAATKCDGGAYLSKIEKNSAFAQAGVEEDSMIMKVGDIELDKFGMAKNKEFAQDTALFHDLIFMDSDISKDATITTCKCGKMSTHTVSHLWNTEMKSPLVDEPQPDLIRAGFVRFAGVTFQQLSKDIAQKLVMEGQRLDLVPYVLGDNKKSAVIVTSTDGLPVEDAKQALQVGSVVTHLNGKPVSDLAEFGEAFKPTSMEECSAGGSESSDMAARKEETKFGGASWLEGGSVSWVEKCQPSGDEPWVLKTADGEIFAVPYAQQLEKMAKNAPIAQFNTLTNDAMRCEGINRSAQAESFVDEKKEIKVYAVEEKQNVHRGGYVDWTTKFGGTTKRVV